MAGKRHHFIPQFLQSGFASHSVGDSFFAWVYRAGKKPFNTNIINVGVEGQFYSQGENSEVDDLITDAEAGYSRLVNNLRSNDEKALADSRVIGELIAHLEIRTRQLREGFLDVAGALAREMFRFIQDDQKIEAYLRHKLKKDPAFLRDMLKEELERSGLHGQVAEEALMRLQPMIEQMIPEFVIAIKAHALIFQNEFIPKMRDAAKNGHLRALKESLAPPIKIEIYQKFEYQVFFFEGNLLPLGDSMVFFETSGERRFRPFSEPDDLIASVYLPLSSNCILIGRSDHKVPSVLNLEQLSLAIVKCSREWFVCANDKVRGNLQAEIGKFSYLLSDADMESILSEIFDNKIK